MLAQVAQRGGRCPIPGNTEGQVGQGSEQPDPGEDVPARCRGLDQMAMEGLFQPKPFCDSTCRDGRVRLMAGSGSNGPGGLDFQQKGIKSSWDFI